MESTPTPTPIDLHDYAPTPDSFLEELVCGLSATPKMIPSKFFYDEAGARLFEEICALDEYYPTRTEIAILERHASEMAAQLGPHGRLVELGSGAGIKTRILLDHLNRPAAYLPVDISRTQLLETAALLARDYPALEVLPVCADYSQPFRVPCPKRPVARTVAFFPGSTIGNFEPDAAEGFLRRVADLVGYEGGLLIGVDLKKDHARLERAYNDARGVTAAFNLNLLARANRELGADFRLDGFRHHAFYNPAHGRIEMHLISRQPQTVRLGGRAFEFATGEHVITEYSYKYSLAEFRQLAARAGFALARVWTDADALFAVYYLTVVLPVRAR
jgi:dimethylhistidine N-methyltransferase